MLQAGMVNFAKSVFGARENDAEGLVGYTEFRQDFAFRPFVEVKRLQDFAVTGGKLVHAGDDGVVEFENIGMG